MPNAQIVQHLRPGGIESLALAILEQQPNDIIISLEGNKRSAINAWPKLKRYENRIFFLGKSPGLSKKTILSLKRLLKRKNINAIHTHHIGPYIYGGTAAKLVRIKNHIHTEHDGWHLQNAKHSRIQRLLNCILKPTLVADAYEVANVVLSKTGAESHVIHNGIDTNQFTPCLNNIEKSHLRLKFGMDLSHIWVGTSGRLERVKGHAHLIRAMAHLPDCFRLVLAGQGSLLNELKIIAADYNIQERILFLGHIDNTSEFYKAIDIFCLPSLREGFPLAPLEAQSCGIPSIVSDVGGATETLCPKTGLSVKPSDEMELVSAITKSYLIDKTFSPRDFIVNHFSLPIMARAYERLMHA